MRPLASLERTPRPGEVGMRLSLCKGGLLHSAETYYILYCIVGTEARISGAGRIVRLTAATMR